MIPGNASQNFPSARGAGARGWNAYDHSKEGVPKAIDDSLKALGTDRVDLYYLHAPDREVPFEETLAAINEEYKAGKFERFGVSNCECEGSNEHT